MAYLSYLGSSLLLLAFFIWLYWRITPLDELALIHHGGQAAAISLSGAVLGFALTLASSAMHLSRWPDFIMWALLGMLVQVLLHWLMSRVLKNLVQSLIANNVAVGILAGAIHLAVGLINAGSLS